jgi:hypothetical protein
MGKLDELLNKLDEASGQINEARDPRSLAKSIFTRLFDTDVVDSDQLYDELDGIEDLAERKQVEKIIEDYIKQMKAFARTIK